MTPRRRPLAAARWATALTLMVSLLVIAQAAHDQPGRPPRLGLTGARSDGGLIVERVQPASFAWDAGVRRGDRVNTIDGRTVTPDENPETLANAAEVAVVSPVKGQIIARADTQPVLNSPLRQASLRVLSIALVGIGATVFVVAQQIAAAGALLALSTTAATMIEATIGQVAGAEWALVLTYVAAVMFGGSTLLLFLLFPINRFLGRRGTAIRWSTLTVHFSLIGAYFLILLVDPGLYEGLQKITLGVLAFDFLGAIGLLVAALTRHEHQSAANLKLLAVGAVTAFTPFTLLTLVPYGMGFGFLVPPDITILSLLALPASIGAALLSRQFLGATRLARRGLVALGVWVALLAAYSVFWNLAVRTVPAGTAVDLWIGSPVVAVASIAATFPFVQRWLRRALEHALFWDVYDYAGTLRSISEELVHISKAEPIARHVLMRLGQTLDLAWAEIVLPDGEHQTQFAWEAPRVAFLSAGSPSEPPRDVAARIPLLVENHEIGRIEVGPKLQDIDLLPDDLLLLETLAPMVATALQNARLLEQLQEQIEILSEREGQLAALSSRLIEVHEEERSRLALDLHDDPLQRALLLARQLSEANGQVGTAPWRREAEDIVQSLKAICAGLRPPTLDDFGLPAGLDWLLDEVGARSEMVGSLNVSPSNRDNFGRLDLDLELALYRVGQEALTNCVKHSGGTQVSVELRRTPFDVTLEVQDDGLGYEATRNSGNHGAQSGLHLGIMGMRERLRPWNGSVDIESEPGHGTLVRARVPLEETIGRQN